MISSENTTIYLRYETEIKQSSIQYTTDNNELLSHREEKRRHIYCSSEMSSFRLMLTYTFTAIDNALTSTEQSL